MKTILLILTLFWFTNSFANKQEPPAPLVGLYEFSQNFHVHQSRVEEIVYTSSNKGQARLNELIQLSYSCKNAGRSTFVCKKNVEVKMTQNLARKIMAEYENTYYNFLTPFGDPSIVNESEVYIEWSFNQQVVSDKYNFTNVNFFRNGDLEKLTLFSGTKALDYLVISKTGVNKLVQFSEKTSDRNITHTFTVMLEYSK